MGPPLIVHLGTVHPGDIALLFDAVPTILNDVPDARVAMVGGYRGSIPNELLARGTVLRTGFVSRPVLLKWLEAASVCVIPLRDNIANRGRWPGKINEYMTAGRATVMTHVGDAAEVLVQSGAGWTCEPNSAALADAIARALRAAEEAEGAEERAGQLARTSLAWPRLAETLDGFYAAVMNRRQVALSA